MRNGKKPTHSSGGRIWYILNSTLDIVLIIVFVLIFLTGLYTVIDSFLVYEHAADSSLLKYKPTAVSSGDNRKIDGEVAWLTLDDTNIDYPVMQGIDNTEYLNKDPYGDYSLSGSIFLDASNSPDFSDSYNLVYGHHMDQNMMFGPLDHYTDPAFFQKHRTGSLTVGKKYYRLDIFAVWQTVSENDTVFSPKEHTASEVVAAVEKNADIYDTDWPAETADTKSASTDATSNGAHLKNGAEIQPDHVLALSTCKDTDSTKRIVVFAQMTQTDPPAASNTGRVRVKNISPFSILPWIVLTAVVVLIIWILRRKKPSRGNADQPDAIGQRSASDQMKSNSKGNSGKSGKSEKSR